MNKKTFDDMPSIMNSISYHLKRIADQLEDHNDMIEQANLHKKPDVMKKIKTTSNLQDYLKSLK